MQDPREANSDAVVSIHDELVCGPSGKAGRRFIARTKYDTGSITRNTLDVLPPPTCIALRTLVSHLSHQLVNPPLDLLRTPPHPHLATGPLLTHVRDSLLHA